MKFSKQKLSKLKQKNKKLNPSKYKKLKRDSIRGRIKGTSERPRLSIYRSNEHLYVQIINDEIGNTLIVCSTRQREVKLKTSNGRTCEAANILGKELAKQSLKKGITKVVFDRSIYMYHGRIQALTEAARNNGLQF